MLHFLGEIEAIFGIWVLALMGAMMGFYDVGYGKELHFESEFYRAHVCGDYHGSCFDAAGIAFR